MQGYIIDTRKGGTEYEREFFNTRLTQCTFNKNRLPYFCILVMTLTMHVRVQSFLNVSLFLENAAFRDMALFSLILLEMNLV